MQVGNGATAVHIRWMGSAWDAPDAHFDALEENGEPGPSENPPSSPAASDDPQRPRAEPGNDVSENRFGARMEATQQTDWDAQDNAIDDTSTERDSRSEPGTERAEPMAHGQGHMAK